MFFTVGRDYSPIAMPMATPMVPTMATLTITFSAGASAVSFEIGIIDDDSEEGGPEEFTVKIISVEPNADIGIPSSTTVKIFDDDCECAFPIHNY